MTMKVLVGSQAQAMLVEVEGVGLTPVDVQRNAVNVARSLHHIPDPVAIVDDHKSAKVYRSIARQKQAEIIRSLRATTTVNVPFFRQRESRYAH